LVRSSVNPLDPRIDNYAGVQLFASFQTSARNPRVSAASAPLGSRMA
jgi:hypothetical protein